MQKEPNKLGLNPHRTDKNVILSSSPPLHRFLWFNDRKECMGRREFQKRTAHLLSQQREMVREYEAALPSTLIISMAGSIPERQDLFSWMMNESKTEGKLFRYASGCSILCERNDAERLLSHYNERSVRAFGRPVMIQARRAYPRYIPELVLQQQEREGKALWNLELIEAHKAQQITTGKGSVVAILDTGIDYTHPDLEQRFDDEKGASFVGGPPIDMNGHGTHVAGTVAGVKTGVAPGAKLYAVKVLNDMGFGSEADVIAGIEWAIEKGVDVISMSLGSSYRSDLEAEVCMAAYQRGICICAAAGNEGKGDEYPASYPGVISVAAVDHDLGHPPFSNISDNLDICAPGVGIYSTMPGNRYDTLTGTSMATPHVSGVIALLADYLQKGPEELEQRIKYSSRHLGHDNFFGAGLIQAYQALHHGT